MRHPFPLAALLAALLAAAPLPAQAVIEAGMTPAQVRGAFGQPARTRDADDWTYWFYSNGCPNRCGSDDVVFFQDGRVVAAVLRTRARRFDGPRAGPALEGLDPNPPEGSTPLGEGEAGTIVIRPGSRGEGGVAPATVEGVRVTGPGEQRPATRNQIREGTPGAPASTIIRPPAAGAGAPGRAEPFGTGGETRGLNARGSRANQANQAPVDTALDQSQVDRERRVTPRTIPAGEPGAAQADTSLDQARIDRERQVTPRTIRPQPAPPARAQPAPRRRGTEPVPNDTTRGKTGITPPGTPPRR